VNFFLPNFSEQNFKYSNKWNWQSGYPCIVPDIRGKDFSNSSLSLMSVVVCHKS
jgi:hypothetical protein